MAGLYYFTGRPQSPCRYSALCCCSGLCLRELAVKGFGCSLFWICFSVSLSAHTCANTSAYMEQFSCSCCSPTEVTGTKIYFGGDFFNSTLKEVTWHPADLAWSKTLSTGKTWDKQYKIKAIVGNELFSLLWAKRQAYFWFYTDSMCQWWKLPFPPERISKNPRAVGWSKAIRVPKKSWQNYFICLWIQFHCWCQLI